MSDPLVGDPLPKFIEGIGIPFFSLKTRLFIRKLSNW